MRITDGQIWNRVVSVYFVWAGMLHDLNGVDTSALAVEETRFMTARLRQTRPHQVKNNITIVEHQLSYIRLLCNAITDRLGLKPL